MSVTEHSCLTDPARSVLVVAPAGSGKTHRLTQRYLACLASVPEPEAVLALTFTNAAAAEMRERVLEALAEAAAGGGSELARRAHAHAQAAGWDLERNPGRLRIMTIDAFAAYLASRQPLLSGLGGGVEIDERPEHLYQAAVMSLMDALDETDPDGALAAAREAFARVLAQAEGRIDQVMDMLVALLATREQWLPYVLGEDPGAAVAQALEAAVRRRLERALALLPPRTVLDALARALAEAAEHGAFVWARGLERWPEPEPVNVTVWRRLAETVLTQKGTPRTRLDRRMGIDAANPARGALAGALRDFAEACDGAGARALAEAALLPEPEAATEVGDYCRALGQLLVTLVAQLGVVFAERGRVDFTEVTLRALDALGAGEYTDLLGSVSDEIHHLLVDEAQDTSALQWRLLEALVAPWGGEAGRSVFFVGDPQQSIYGFRQADVTRFLELLETGRFGDLPLEIVRLRRNFRSGPEIIGWVNEVCGGAFPEASDREVGEVAYAEAEPVREPGATVEVSVRTGDDPAWEADEVVRRIHEARARYGDGAEIALLVRSRTHLREVLPRLHAAGIAFSCRELDRLSDRPAVEDVLALVRALAHPADRLWWLRLLRAPFVGLGWADVLEVARREQPLLVEALAVALAEGALSRGGARRAQRLLDGLRACEADTWLRARLPERARALWHALLGPRCLRPEEVRDVEAVFALLDRHCEGGQLADLERFERAVAALRASTVAAGARVQVMTIHEAKGLDFDVVIVCGAGCRGAQDLPPLLAHRRVPGGFLLAPNPGRRTRGREAARRLFDFVCGLERRAALAELRRLFYVAVTRPRRALYIVGHVEPAGEGDAVRPAYGSLLGVVWEALEALIDPVADGGQAGPAAPEGRVGVPVAPRLRLDVGYAELGRLYVPRADRDRLPSEAVLRGVPDAEAGARGHRILGTVYHALVEQIGRHGTAWWQGRPASERRRLVEALLARHGAGLAAQRAFAVAVETLVERTLRSRIGVWLLTAPGAEREVRLAAWDGRRWANGIIDVLLRVGEEAWVIDYKTAGALSEPADVTRAWVQAEVAQYAEALERYRALVSGLWPDVRAVRAALYYPAHDLLVEVPSARPLPVEALMPQAAGGRAEARAAAG